MGARYDSSNMLACFVIQRLPDWPPYGRASDTSQMLPHERRYLPRIDRFPWQFGRRVMAAGQPDDIEIDTALSHFVDDFTRKVRGKCQVVFCRDEADRSRFHVQQPWNERHGAYRPPKFA